MTPQTITITTIFIACIPGLGFAAEPSSLTYRQFEAAVPHLDLETCPSSLPQENTFCRATLQHDEIHVFVFSEDGDSPLIGFSSFPSNGLATLLN